MDEVELPFESDEELIVELVSLPQWRAYKRVVARYSEELRRKIMAPSRVFPDDFYKREQLASEIRALDVMVEVVEKQAERRLRKGSQRR